MERPRARARGRFISRIVAPRYDYPAFATTRRSERGCGMSVSFRSSHVGGDFSGGRLTIDIVSPEPARAVSAFFAVPADFHTHNDCVAAALMTLLGRTYPDVALNFPISSHCAHHLTTYYQLDAIGPVDESLEPRRPGHYLALNFSGGMDSTLVWVLLREYVGAEVKVITSEYEHFKYERVGWSGYHRDVSCLTNLRGLKLDLAGRFNFAVPLLFADYADIWGVACGHTYDHAPRSLESLVAGQRPRFLEQDASLQAGGLTEVHLVRGMFELATGIALARAAPERVEAALTASGAPGTRKHATKHLVLRNEFNRLGLPVPAYLREEEMPTVASRVEGIGWRALWMWKHISPEFAIRFDPRVADVDMSIVDGLRLTFLERYNANFVELVPPDIRTRFYSALHQLDFVPYDEQDFVELQLVREFLVEQGREIETPLGRRTAAPAGH